MTEEEKTKKAEARLKKWKNIAAWKKAKIEAELEKS